MKAYRHFLWIFFLFVPLLWLVWPSSDKAEQKADTPPMVESRKQNRSPGSPAADGGLTPENLSRRSPRRTNDTKHGDMAAVDRILANDDISHEQAARQLRELAMDSKRSVEDRLEALEHGLNLHAESFADFAQQKDLPPELASHYLHEMINLSDSPSIQIRSYMALMDHPDTEVAELAKDMLALEVGDEEQISTREKLLVVGESKLAKLAAEAGK